MTTSLRKACCVAGAILFATHHAWAADAIGPALDRPAQMVRAPERAVLLAAAAAGTDWVTVGERGIVLRSQDGGRQWTQMATPTSITLTAVRFADAQHGMAVGHGGTVLVTEDGGTHWERRLDGRRIADLLLADAQARGDAAAQKAAEQLRADGPDKPLLDVLLLDAPRPAAARQAPQGGQANSGAAQRLLEGPQRALVVGAYGLALATEDGGRTWTSWGHRLDNPKALHLYAVRQRGQRVVIAGEQGLAYKSDDGGLTFQTLVTPYKGSYFTAELLGEHDIVLAGLRGNVWRSTNDGQAWQALVAPMPVSLVASQIAADGTLLLANQAGFVLALRGDALVPVNREPLPPLNSLAVGPKGALLALSIQGVMPVVPKP